MPALAWCARVDRHDEVVPVFHGSGVETHPSGFVEGAWNGCFAALNFIDATIVAGTGGTLAGDGVRFSTSTDPSSPIFSIATRGSVYVSNSPSFALAAAGERPDDIYPFYPYDLLDIFRKGLGCQAGPLRLSSSTALHVHFLTTVCVAAEGALAFEHHRSGESPGDYRSYIDELSNGVRQLVANAADPLRNRRYKPLASLSKGYDSTAAAVLARSAGCTETFTLVDTRRDDLEADSGAENARLLGMSCTSYSRWQYLDLDDCPEVEFGYAATACAVPLVAAESELSGRLLITGEFGDAIWDPQRARLFDGMRRPVIGYTLGLSPIEFRLRIGYYAFAPTCIGARHNQALYDIAISEEMRPWSIGGDYDRPIPRRIVEEAGLARDRFGMRKHASAHSHLIFPGRYSRNALDDYRSFVNQCHAAIPRDVYRYWRSEVQRRHDRWEGVGGSAVRHPGAAASPLDAKPILIPWNFMFTLQWTVASMRDRYASAAQRCRLEGATRGSVDTSERRARGSEFGTG